MWPQTYTPIANSLALSGLAAALPIFVLLVLLGLKRRPAWEASLAGVAGAALVAAAVYRMPFGPLVQSILYGAAFGLFPIGWVVFTAILLFRLTVETGHFEVIKDSIGSISGDPRLQALLIAFAFGAFIEGAAGFGTPVAVAGAMLAGVGFAPFEAAALCLLANTSPVAFGSIGVPLVTLATVTGLPLARLSAAVGRICAPVSLFVPAYLVGVQSGRRGLRGVWPAAAVCGAAFAVTQFAVSNFIGAQLTDILASLAAMGALLLLLSFWKPKSSLTHSPELPALERSRHSTPVLVRSWAPYAFLVLFVLLWGFGPVKARLERTTVSFTWPGLHNAIERIPPVVSRASPYAAVYSFPWLAASGTACLLAAICGAFLALGMKPAAFLRVCSSTLRKLLLAELTIAAVLALAFLMNYSGATATLGMAFAATGRAFPFFSSLLGWLGVFLTGSDTSSNALFGNLQVVTAGRIGLSPVLMAAANSSGGVMGKMISLQSIAVAAAATGLAHSDEARLFRFTLKHSLLLVAVVGVIATLYTYVWPGWIP
ncbi:MAG TPA: lactate permease LctP family transporter [Candidatus Acidoferrales bacterium]|nr:lactate permease LctP family transporter [Candidatus Acidoferrales bacterium]